MKSFLQKGLLLFLITSCSNLLDSEVGQRNTFIKLYNGIFGIEASAIEPTPDGYVILGTLRTNVDSVYYSVAFKTDKQGNRIGDIQYYLAYNGFTGKAIKTLPDNSGYLIVGERLNRNQARTPADNIDIYASLMLPVNNDLVAGTPRYRRDDNPVDPLGIRIDYRASSLTMVPGKNEVIVLGTYQRNNTEPERPYLQSYNTNLGILNWTQDFESEIRSFRNSKSVHYNNGKITWASAVSLVSGSFNFGYVSIPTVKEASVFINNSQLGNNDQLFLPSDICTSSLTDLGYGLVGTRSNTDGSNANIFFMRVDANGNINTSSLIYFDTILSGKNEAVTPSTSEVLDFGSAITATSDGGYVLAGHFITSNGTSDIVLIKLDALGNQLWLKTLGGTGSEVVSNILETEDGGLLICGTHTIGLVPSIFLIKTNTNGELNK